MSFDDLPADWQTRSLGDPTLTLDVIDLFARMADRRDNTLITLLCDHAGRLLQPVAISRIPWGCAAEDRARAFDWLGQFPRNHGNGAGIAGAVLAFCHRQPRIRASDVRWAETARDRFDDLGLELFGCYVAHYGGVHPLGFTEGQVA